MLRRDWIKAVDDGKQDGGQMDDHDEEEVLGDEKKMKILQRFLEREIEIQRQIHRRGCKSPTTECPRRRQLSIFHETHFSSSVILKDWTMVNFEIV